MLVSSLSLVLLGPAGPSDLDTGVHDCVHPEDPSVWSDEPEAPTSVSYDCTEHKDTGYVSGSPFEITVVTVDGDPVEVQTANAFIMLAAAAAQDGVGLKINSGFRTMSEQQYFYNCYINCNCNSCNVAAKPGYSNHQSGHALDINTASPGVLSWLNAHGPSYGWERTVPSEPWHWEWWGGGPPANGPCGTPDYAAKYANQSFPLASQPPVVLTVGDELDAWIELENVGKKTWTSTTRLAPTPRDVASPLVASDWLSPTRIVGPHADVPPGNIGRFDFNIYAAAPGEYYQTFGLLEEGVTWFSDKPLGGGPPDDQLQVRILVVSPAPPIPPPPSDDTTGADESSAGDDEGTVTGTGTGIGDGGEADGDDTGVPTSGGSTSSASSAGPATGDLDDSAGHDKADEGCGCNTRASHGPWLLLLSLLALPRARKRRVSAP